MSQDYPLLSEYLILMEKHHASDLYLTVGCPPSLRIDNKIVSANPDLLTDEHIETFLNELLDDEQRGEFEDTLEFNSAIQPDSNSRFRVNVFRQQMNTGIVLRRINTDIPTLEELKLPSLLGDLAMAERGLILIVGGTGSGKSTTLASLIGHRNLHGSGHIITIEDPIEFVHAHQGCIITQRDVGIDTYSYGMALKNALRQRPDVLLIGEIRDRETMEHAVNFSETGHLVFATLHANNSNQAIERIVSFFPEEKQHQVLLTLSLNLKAIVAQRLVNNIQGNRSLALEILLNEGAIKQLIEEGSIRKLKELIERNADVGMQSFDQALFALSQSGEITEEVAIAQADNPANVRLRIRQEQGAAHAKDIRVSESEDDIY